MSIPMSRTFLEKRVALCRYPLNAMGGRNDQVNVRLTDDEKRLVGRAAEKDSRSVSEWLRNVVLDRARREMGGAAPIKPPDPRETAILEELRRLEALNTSLPNVLLDLGAASIRRPRLLRALTELAEEDRGDGPRGIGGESRRGQR